MHIDFWLIFTVLAMLPSSIALVGVIYLATAD